ncbi:MAG: hypothetical protein GY696_20190 [Gammaproteobacteria bacterium]|nr:hypothetical protein [Gammaproteobacteria bacterium]
MKRHKIQRRRRKKTPEETNPVDSMHPSVDGEGRKLSIKEALPGEGAIQGQHITKASGGLTADQMIERLDSVFMPKQESSLARLEFKQYKQHPDKPV